MAKMDTNTGTVTLTIEELKALLGAVETGAVKTAKQEKTAGKAEKPGLNANQKRVIDGVINRAAKYGYRLSYYVTGTWIWFENVDGGETYKTRGGATLHKDVSEGFASLRLSTKSTKVCYSKKRGQFYIKDFISK